MRRALRIVALLAIAAGLWFAKPYVFPEKKVEVEVFRAARGDVRETVTSPTSGTIISRREAVVAAEANGRVATIVLQEGDRAAEGAAVVLLEDADAAVDVRAAEAALATRRTALESAELRYGKAEEDLKSGEPLHNRKLMSDEQFRAWKTVRDTSRVDVEAARRALREAEVAVERARVVLARRRVSAPFAGMIRRKLVEAGGYVTVGTPCFEIFDDQHIFVRAPLDEVDLPRVRPGLAVDVALEPFGERLFRGVIRRIEPGVRTARELNRTGEVEVELTDVPQPKEDGSYPPGEGPIRVGMSADIEVVTSTQADVLRVPAYAVHEDDLDHYVFVVEEGRIARRKVQVGATNWDFAEIRSGLSEGAAVIVSLDVAGLESGKAASIKRELKRVEPQ